ncbi:hypothetical protein 1 [Hubei myriapoda virus 8]|uniref:Uncharacterized protein n=1 Tax=Hubei myriapoda virus 8 TaxID=1922937 RepID=A0A1L3KN38_9VIRU|nr:hypothetical protein 1 [Hubei myriapoda virus 8]APG78797.1 hypothetical protein 1 [Hubei myriapoda virus 8]
MAGAPPFVGLVWQTVLDCFKDLPDEQKLWFGHVYGGGTGATDLIARESCLLAMICLKYRVEVLRQELAIREEGGLAIKTVEVLMTENIDDAMCAPADMALHWITSALEHYCRTPFNVSGVWNNADWFEYDHIIVAEAGAVPAHFGGLRENHGFPGVEGNIVRARLIRDLHSKADVKAILVFLLREAAVVDRAERGMHKLFAHFFCALSQRGNATENWIAKRQEDFRNQLNDQTFVLNSLAMQIIWKNWLSKIVFPELKFVNSLAYLEANQLKTGQRMMLTVEHSAYKGLAAYGFISSAFNQLPAESFAWAALDECIPQNEMDAYEIARDIILEGSHAMYGTREVQNRLKATRYPSLAYFGVQYATRVVRNIMANGYRGVGSNEKDVANRALIDEIITRLQQELGRRDYIAGIEQNAEGRNLRYRMLALDNPNDGNDV